MTKYREILRLSSLNLSQQNIAISGVKRPVDVCFFSCYYEITDEAVNWWGKDIVVKEYVKVNKAIADVWRLFVV